MRLSKIGIVLCLAAAACIGQDTYTIRNRGNGRATMENDRDPSDTYTIRNRGNGRATMENDRDPLDTYTIRNRGNGRATVENDYPRHKK